MARGRGLRRWAPVALALALAFGSAVFSAASLGAGGEQTRAGTRTFDGSCRLSGRVRFDPPLTNSPQHGTVSAVMRGSCSGTLTNRRGRPRSVDGQIVRFVGSSSGSESCGAGQGTGRGYLAFRRHRLRFTYDEVRVGPAPLIRLQGRGGGSAVAEANVSPSADPAAIAQACGGSGLVGAPIDATLRTTPTISG